MADIDTLERVFVAGFPTSTTRRPIFERYQAFNAWLREILPDGFTQWVDGSFVSRKQNPRDIDVLTFVNIAHYQQHQRTLSVLN